MSIALQFADCVFRARFLSAFVESPVWNTATVSVVILEVFFVVFACVLLATLASPNREPLTGPTDGGRFASPGDAPAPEDWLVWQATFARSDNDTSWDSSEPPRATSPSTPDRSPEGNVKIV